MKYPFDKIELHCHLDGSFRSKTMYDLAQARNVEIPGKTLEGYEKWMKECSNAESVNDYLKMFDVVTEVLQDEESLARICYELIEDLHHQGVTYAEIRFAPQLHTRKTLNQNMAIEAVLKGRKKALEEFKDININIILCMMCVGTEQVNYQENKETATIVKDYLDKGVVALDLAGAEGFVPLINFAPLFEIARNNNVPLICHAGDSQDWHTCLDAINMGVRRLGHGHHIYENPYLCRVAASKQIALEICPTSNIQCKTRESYKMHPANNLLKMGIPVTINTDNMFMSDTTLEKEYDHCLEEMGFEYKDLITMNINSVKVSFMKEEEKQVIIDRLMKALGKCK